MGCKRCGTYQKCEKCTTCGKIVHIGAWFECPHGTPTPSKGYEPHWDLHIAETPQWISNPGDKRQHLKPRWKDDFVIHTQERG